MVPGEQGFNQTRVRLGGPPVATTEAHDALDSGAPAIRAPTGTGPGHQIAPDLADRARTGPQDSGG